MPGRKTPIVTNLIYHVYNRGSNHQTTFSSIKEYKRAIETLKYYQYSGQSVRLAHFLTSDVKRQNEILALLSNKDRNVEILAFCLMPNHYHFILKQKVDSGISKFISKFTNSYTKYFNKKNKRDGALFLDQFKAVAIESEEQLLHTLRYVHLNPVTAQLTTFKALVNYEWCSYRSYIENLGLGLEMENLLLYFKSKKRFVDFHTDQGDYQKTLAIMKHNFIDNEQFS